MDGLLVVDKPAGPTSHDVVARIRRLLGERRIGHTGTLDPMATGVLALVVGKATRLAQFLSRSDKSYEAVVRLGFSTDTGDAQGTAIGDVRSSVRSRGEIDAALNAFRGTFMQQPPAFSAKMIDGTRSHKLARARRRSGAWHVPGTDRRARAVNPQLTRSVPAVNPQPGIAEIAMPAPASVSTTAIEILAIDDDRVTLRVDCSAGFYVRSLAHDLGEALGTGAHLVALRRTRSGDATLDDAVPLAVAERDPSAVAARIVPLARMLPGLPSITLTAEGVERVGHGRHVGPGLGIVDPGPARRESGLESRSDSPATNAESGLYRLLDERGALIAIGRPSAIAGALHPSIVLM